MDSFADLQGLYDETAYLQKHKDVAAAVEAGREKSGWTHFLRRGQFEGRVILGFDSPFYLRSYPLAVEDIAAGRAATAFEHYARFGRARGYLPSQNGPRPDNAAANANRFGGFWLDQANARDIVRGKQEVGFITAEEARQLEFWIDNGYVILNKAIPAEILDAALEDFDRGYSGRLRGLLFECQEVVKSRRASPWQPAMNDFPTKALDIHFFSSAIRDLIFSRQVARFLSLLFDAPAYATQSLGFLLGSAQDGHQDSAYVAYSIPRQFCASWIALEDVTAGAGELFYYPGSHKYPDFLYSGRYKSLHEAMRVEGGQFPAGEVSRHVKSLKERAKELGLKKQTLLAKKGDVLIWHADLVHGGSPVTQGVTRKSVVTHYCPKFVSPLFSENRKSKMFHHKGYCFSTSYYLDAEPAMQEG